MKIFYAALFLVLIAGLALWGILEFMRLPDSALFAVMSAILLAFLAALLATKNENRSQKKIY